MKPNQDFVTKCKKLVSSGDISGAIDILLENPSYSRKEKELLVLRSRLKRVKDAEVLGTKSADTIEHTRNQISSSLLVIIEDASNEDYQLVDSRNQTLEQEPKIEIKNEDNVSFLEMAFQSISIFLLTVIQLAIVFYFATLISKKIRLFQYNGLMFWLWYSLIILSVSALFDYLGAIVKKINSYPKKVPELTKKKRLIRISRNIVIPILVMVIIALIPFLGKPLIVNAIDYFFRDRTGTNQVLIEEVLKSGNLDVKIAGVEALEYFKDEESAEGLINIIKENLDNLTDNRFHQEIVETYASYGKVAMEVLEVFFLEEKQNYIKSTDRVIELSKYIEQNLELSQNSALPGILDNQTIDENRKQEIINRIKKLQFLIKTETSELQNMTFGIDFDYSALPLIYDIILKMKVLSGKIYKQSKLIAVDDSFGNDIRHKALLTIARYTKSKDIEFFIEIMDNTRDDELKRSCLMAIEKFKMIEQDGEPEYY